MLPLPNKLFYGSNLRLVKPLADALGTLRVLIDSSAPIVVMETVEEVRAVRLVRTQGLGTGACGSGFAGRCKGRRRVNIVYRFTVVFAAIDSHPIPGVPLTQW